MRLSAVMTLIKIVIIKGFTRVAAKQNTVCGKWPNKYVNNDTHITETRFVDDFHCTFRNQTLTHTHSFNNTQTLLLFKNNMS